MVVQISQCSLCRHRKKGMSCAAFKEIPREIFFNEIKHDKPYEGDHGIQFEEKKKEKKSWKGWY